MASNFHRICRPLLDPDLYDVPLGIYFLTQRDLLVPWHLANERGPPLHLGHFTIYIDHDVLDRGTYHGSSRIPHRGLVG